MTMWSRKITLTRAPQGSSEYMYFFCFSFFLLLSNFGYGKCTNLITVEFDLLQNNCLGINFALIVRIGSDEYTYSIPVHQNGDSNHFEMDHIQIFSSDSVQFLWTYCYSPDTNESCCWTVDNARTSSFDIATLPTTNRVESCSSKNLEFSMDGKYSFQSKCSYKNLDIDLSNPPKTEDCSNMDDVIEISSCVFATSTASTFFPTTNVRYTTHTITHGITSSSVLLATPLPATELPSKDCEGDGKVWMTTVSGSNSTGINYCHNGITNGTRQCRENGTWDSPYCTSLIEIAKNMTGRSLEERIDFLLLISNILPEDETVTLLPILENVLNFASQLNATNQTIQNVSVTSLQILVNVVNFASQSKLTDQNFSVLSLQILENLLNFVSHSNPTNRIIQNVSETSLRILESLLNFTSQSNPTEQIIQNVTVSSVQILVNLVNFASQSNPTDQNFSVLSLQLLENLLNLVSYSNPTNRIIQNVSETSLRILESLLNFTSQSNPTEQIIQNVTVSSEQILVKLLNLALQSNPTQQIIQNVTVLSLQVFENLLSFASQSSPTQQIMQRMSVSSLETLKNLLNFAPNLNPNEQKVQKLLVTSLQIHMLEELLNFESRSNTTEQNTLVSSFPILVSLLNSTMQSNLTEHIIQNVSVISVQILENLLNFASQSNTDQQIVQEVSVLSLGILVNLLNFTSQVNPTRLIIQNASMSSLQILDNSLSSFSPSFTAEQITPEVLMIATLIVSFYGSQTDQALTTQYKDERYNVSSRLVLILDNFGKLLEQYSHMICIEDYCIGINVTEVQNPLQDEITVLSINGNSVNIFLHPELWNTVESVRIIALYYSNISFLLKPQNTTEMILPQVLSAFIDCQTCDTLQNIVENVTIQFNISKVFSDDFQIDDFEITCVFFKFTDERYFAGIWESTGCSTQVVGNTSVICTCDHLTHFAILLSPRATFSDTDTKILTTVGLVIVSISLVCMVAVAFIYIVFKSLWNMRTYIHIMLCISLFAAQLLFVIGIDRTKNKGVCSAIAVTLQYLFLVAFMWMLMEGLVLYVSLSQVFIKNTKCYLIGFTTASYGIPVIYMAIVAPTGYLVHTEDLYENTHYLYQNGSACWLSDESGFIWSFISPVILILLLNICFFVMTLFVMKKHEKKVHGKHAARRWLRVSVSLTAVMGVTWLGGLLVINELEIFAYVMVPVLTSQGLLIFIVLVPLSRQVRQAILQMLRKKFPHSRILHSNGFFLFSSNQKRKVENPSKNRVVMGTFGERSFSTPNNQLDNLGENISFKTKESSVTISEESSAMECQTVILHMD